MTNSYKSSTWAQVSSVSLKDINAAEALVFDILSFDVSPSIKEWSDFINGIIYRYSRTRFNQNGSLDRFIDRSNIWPH